MQPGQKKPAFPKISLKPLCPKVGSLLLPAKPDRRPPLPARGSLDERGLAVSANDFQQPSHICTERTVVPKQSSFLIKKSAVQHIFTPLSNAPLGKPTKTRAQELATPSSNSSGSNLPSSDANAKSLRSSAVLYGFPRKKTNPNNLVGEAGGAHFRNRLSFFQSPSDRFIRTSKPQEPRPTGALKPFLDRKMKQIKVKDGRPRPLHTQSSNELVFTKKRLGDQSKFDDCLEESELKIAQVLTYTYQAKEEPKGESVKRAFHKAIRNSLANPADRYRKGGAGASQSSDKLQITNLFFMSSDSNRSSKSILKTNGARSNSDKHVSFDEAYNREHLVECEFIGVSSTVKSLSHKSRNKTRLDFSLPLIYDQFSLKIDESKLS